jgi:hypothetical protein
VALNIPDTSDVKETFGSVINTVVEQHEEIQDLHTGLETTTVETVESQRKMLAWTASCIRKLKYDNERLQAKLVDSNKQIKNLSYNMQGFVDVAQEDESEASPDPIEFDDIPQIKVHGHSTMFATEEGAPVGAEDMTMTPQIRKFAKYKGAEQREKALAMYNAVGPNTLPNNPHARWRWAIRKVMSSLRKKRMKVGLTRSRMDPKQTFAGRLDRVEAMMLSMNGDLRGRLSDMDKRINHKVDTEVRRLNLEVSTAAGKLHMLMEECGVRFKALQEEVGMVDATMREFFAKVQQQASGDTKQMRETLKAVESHLKDLVHMDLDSLRSGVNFVTTEMDQMEGTADKLLQRVETLHAVSSSQPPYNPAAPIDQAMADLTDLLQTDTQYREARQDLLKLQAGLASVHRAYGTVNQHVVVSAHHYCKESVQTAPIEIMNASQLEDLNELSQRCVGADGHIKHIDAILASLDRMCLEHDKVLKDRLRVFAALSKRVRDIASSSEQLAKTQSSHFAQISAPASPTPVSMNAGGGMTMEQIKLMARFDHDISELNMRVGFIEGMRALDDAIGFEQEEDEVVQEELVWRPPPVVPQDAIGQGRVTSEKSYSRRTFANLESGATEGEVRTVRIQSSSHTPREAAATDGETDAATAAPFGFRAPAASDPAPMSLESAAAAAIHNTTVNTNTRSFSPVTGPLSGTNTRKSSAYGMGSRKASAVTSLDMLEARLRPLIEKIVAANLEERMQQFGAGDGIDEGDDLLEEERDAFPAEPPATSPVLGAVGDASAPTIASDAPLAAASSDSQDGSGAGLSGAESHLSPSKAPGLRSRQSSTIEFGGARIRREASRFGLGDSGKLRAGSSKSNRGGGGLDITPYVAELTTLKKESSRLGKALGKLEDGRLTADDVERMFHHLFQTNQHHDQKEESKHHIHELEKRVDSLTKEITALHATHLKAIASLQEEFTETLHKVVNTAAASLDADNKESFVSTRALCLGCGRSSMVRSQPEARPMSPSFFPQINQHSTEGPDVFHAGFKLPVKNPLNPAYVLEATCPSPGANRTRAVKSAGQRMQEALAASSVDAGNSNFAGSSLEAVLPRVKNAQPRPHTSHHSRPGGAATTGVNIEDDDDGDEDFVPAGEEGSQVMHITGGALEEPSRVTTTENGSLIIQANKGYQLNIGSTTGTLSARDFLFTL